MKPLVGAVRAHVGAPADRAHRQSNQLLAGKVGLAWFWLSRQYFPEWTSFELVTQQRVDEVTEKLNQTPRKRFGYRPSNEVFKEALKKEGYVAFIT